MPGLVVHCKRARYDVYIGRPGKWGNPFSHRKSEWAKFKTATAEEAVAKYREWLMANPGMIQIAKAELRGKVLGCWCKVKGDEPCHGDVLVEVANS